MFLNRLWGLKKLLLSVLLVSMLVLIGCDGDDGKPGPAGNDGVIGPIGPIGPEGPSGATSPSLITEQMDAEISAAIVEGDGSVSINFTIVDDQGTGFRGLPGNRIRFTLVQLIPSGVLGVGEGSQWQSYINTVENAPTDPENGSGTVDTTQATYERDGNLVDHNDGNYRYTYKVNLNDASNAVVYNEQYTHRVAFQISGGGFPTINRTYDWQPATNQTDSIYSRDMVVAGSCNNCHGELALHGGGRVDTEYCVTCHNPGTTDANSGNSLDFKVMIHKIHQGANLPSVKNGGEYAIWGHNDGKHDYSGTHLPQDIRNCTSCHDHNVAETPDAVNWLNVPTIQACGSCHDDIDFNTGPEASNGHAGGAVTDNGECALCHGQGRFASTFNNHQGVMERKRLVRNHIVTQPIAVRVARESGNIEVDVMITLNGEPVVALRDASGMDTEQGAVFGKYTHGTDNGSLAINWDNGTGFQLNHQEIDFNDCLAAGDGMYTCSAAGLLAGISDNDVITVTAVDLLICMNEQNGEVSRCDSVEDEHTHIAQIEVPPTVAFFMADGSEVIQGYDKIGADISACRSCHLDDKFHHGATELIQCKTCHNATRIGFRGLGDLKRHVHRLHSSLDKNALDDTNPEKIDHFPTNIDNCSACHSATQFDLPIQQNHRASIAAGADSSVYISPTAVVCGSCHLNVKLGLIDPNKPGYMDNSEIAPKEQALIDHMIQNGAVFGATDFSQANKIESCSVCHGIGNDNGVDKVHNVK